MFCKLNSYCLNGTHTLPVEVEIDFSSGLPAFEIVGLPDSAVKEAKERVRSAIKNCGFDFPIARMTINLAPADVKKEGSLYDLPIALGILCCSGLIPPTALENIAFVGELALNGALRPVKGIVPMIQSTLHDGYTFCISCFPPLPKLPDPYITPLRHFTHLSDLIRFLNKQCDSKPIPFLESAAAEDEIDFKDVIGQEEAKKALMVAAAGFHHLLMIGPPGSGKSMLAQRLPYILPPLSSTELMEINKVYSVSNRLPENLLSHRPYRSPHHTVSIQGLSGGGRTCNPGEITLSHKGVLFLDELLEFSKKALEILRQPIETGEITLARAHQRVTYPCDFLLVAATNPCPCGHYPNPNKCACDLHTVQKYLQKLSGPLLDRIDLQIELEPVHLADLNIADGLSTAQMKERVYAAHARMKKRFKNTSYSTNSHIPTASLSRFCKLTSSAEDLIQLWFKSNLSSMRSYHRLLRVARTLADLDDQEMISDLHITQAMSYRLLDRPFWKQK